MESDKRKKRHSKKYRRYRLKKRLELIIISLGIIVCGIAILSAIPVMIESIAVSAGQAVDSPGISGNEVSEKENENISQIAIPNNTPKPENSSSPASSEKTGSSTADDTETSSQSSESVSSVSGYDYSRPVPESEKKGVEYFDDAVFIGDSREEGFVLNAGLSNATSYTHKGLMVDTAFTSPVFTVNGEKLSATEALAKTEFKKVYLQFGTNEAGWVYSNVFIQKYEELIDTIRQINPDALIYVQSILPVSETTSKTHEFVTKSKLDEYNRLLQEMAEEKKVFYVNAAECMANSKGFLPEEAAFDGIHLKKDYCLKWLDYLCTHTVLS